MTSLTTPAVSPGTMSALPQPTLTTSGGLTIRPWDDSDAPVIVKAFSDPATQRWLLLAFTQETEAVEWITARRKAWDAETGANWAVTARGEVVGRIGLMDVNLSRGHASLTAWTLPEARGLSVASQAVEAVTGWCFTTLGLHKMILAHSTANPASCNVARKTGFLYEGTALSHVMHADGWHDMHIHGKVNPVS
jgi:[ribosomal protein S5]-alanine N-acetyltransferase